jgi:trafficking protein particle complex subunit 11
MARLHIPLTMKLVVRNHHPSRAANIAVQLDPDISDGFVVTGLRNGRISILLPGAECSLLWKLIPIECGFVPVPKLKVMDLRKVATTPQNPEDIATETTAENEAFGDAVKIVDVRWDGRDESGRKDNALGGPDVDNETGSSRNDIGTILVLP